jgi:glycogen(starch) synthase
MRVLFWSPCFWPEIGGAEVLAARVLPSLRERGHEFLVVANKPADDLADEAEYQGIPVRRFPFVAALGERDVDRILGLRQRVAQLKRDFRPDLVHSYWLNPSTLFLRYTANFHPSPLLVTLHGGLDVSNDRPRAERDTLVESTLLSADWVAACSAAVLIQARRALPQIVPFSSAIPNALDRPSLLPGPPPTPSLRLLCLGRLVRAKGFDLALAAFAELVGRFPTARLIVAGDGPERTALEEQAAALGIGGAVDFYGWVAPDGVPALINSSTLVVMPSRVEPFGLVALQAAQMARPVVATRVDGLPEVVVDRETGVLVEPEDRRALALAIAFLLESPEASRQIGEAARRRAEEVFSWERHVDAYGALYRTLDATASSGQAR